MLLDLFEWLTGYYGGVVATHVRLDNPLFSHVLFSVYLAIFAWAVAAEAASVHAANAMADANSSRRKIEHDIRSAYRQDAKCR